MIFINISTIILLKSIISQKSVAAIKRENILLFTVFINNLIFKNEYLKKELKGR